MAFYRYTAKTEKGKTVRDIAEAKNKNWLIGELRSKGLCIISVQIGRAHV